MSIVQFIRRPEPESSLSIENIHNVANVLLVGEAVGGLVGIKHDRAEVIGKRLKEIDARLKKWKQPKLRYTRGVLAKYGTVVASASKGAVTDAGLG